MLLLRDCRLVRVRALVPEDAERHGLGTSQQKTTEPLAVVTWMIISAFVPIVPAVPVPVLVLVLNTAIA